MDVSGRVTPTHFSEPNFGARSMERPLFDSKQSREPSLRCWRVPSGWVVINIVAATSIFEINDIACRPASLATPTSEHQPPQHSRIAPFAHSMHRCHDQSDHFGLHDPSQLPRERAHHLDRYVCRLGQDRPALSARAGATSISISGRRSAL